MSQAIHARSPLTTKAAPRAPHPPVGPQQSLLHAATAIPRGASLDSVLSLINQPATRTQFDRQVAELLRCLEAFRVGFSPSVAMDGVPQVVSHFVAAARDAEGPASGLSVAVTTGLNRILELAAQPIVCMTLGDQRKHDAALEALLDAVSSCLAVPSVDVRLSACAALRQVIQHIRNGCHDDVFPAPASATQKRKEHQRCISKSVVSCCVEAWRRALNADHIDPQCGESPSEVPAADDVSDDEDADRQGCRGEPSTASASYVHAELAAIIRVVLELSHYRQLSEWLGALGGLDIVTATVRRCAAGDRRLALCTELVWNMLALNPENVGFVDQQFVSTLMDAFTSTLSIGYKLKERELRNDMLILFTLIAANPAKIPLFADYVELLLDLSCGAEMGIESDLVPAKHHYTTHATEQQAKVLCWKLLHTLSAHGDFARYVLDWGFMEVLMHYVDVHCEVPAVVRWSTLQLLDIQANVLHLLGLLVIVGYEYFSNANGARILHEYIAECPDIALRNLAVGVLARVATTPARADLIAAGSIPLALQLLQQGYDNHGLLVDCLNVLADTVDRDAELQRTFSDNSGVTVVLPLLRLKPTFYTDLQEAVIFAAVDCVWSCVLGDHTAEDTFVAQDGIDALLSIIEDCPRWMVSFPLSCLADFMLSAAAKKEFREWRSGRTGLSGAQVVLSLWETVPPAPPVTALQALGSATVNGDPCAIPTADVTGLETLGTPARCTLELSTEPPAATNGLASGTSIGAGDPLLENFTRVGLDPIPADVAPVIEKTTLHVKIYAILSAVGFEDHKELGPLERGQLATVAAFLDLCHDEIWQSVEASLEAQGVMPISSDAERLRAVREAAAERSKLVQRTRIRCLQQHEQQTRDAEDTFYRSLIKKTDEKRAMQSKGAALSITEAKIRKAQMLKQSFKQALGRQQSGAEDDATAHNAPTATSKRPMDERGQDGGAGEHATRNEPLGAPGALGERWGLGQRAMEDAEYALLQAINKVRTDPPSLIVHLREKLKFLNASGNAFEIPGKEPEHCVEGIAVYEEAITFLGSVRPLVTLLDVPMGLLLAARDHAIDLARRMTVSQTGADGSSPLQRMQRYGKPSATATQMLSLAQRDPLDVVVQLVVDDGVANRIDRRTLFDPDARQCGIAVGTHPIHETVAVILLSSEFVEKPPDEQQRIFARHGGAPLPPPTV